MSIIGFRDLLEQAVTIRVFGTASHWGSQLCEPALGCMSALLEKCLNPVLLPRKTTAWLDCPKAFRRPSYRVELWPLMKGNASVHY